MKEKIIKVVEDITWTDDDTIANCSYDAQPNEAFDAGAAYMKKKIIESIKKIDELSHRHE